jgi:hypothetical protein
MGLISNRPIRNQRLLELMICSRASDDASFFPGSKGHQGTKSYEEFGPNKESDHNGRIIYLIVTHQDYN